MLSVFWPLSWFNVPLSFSFVASNSWNTNLRRKHFFLSKNSRQYFVLNSLSTKNIYPILSLSEIVWMMRSSSIYEGIFFILLIILVGRGFVIALPYWLFSSTFNNFWHKSLILINVCLWISDLVDKVKFFLKEEFSS